MSATRIDARGLSCPQPVVLTSKAIEAGAERFEVLVDNEVSKENVLRLAKRHRMQTSVREEGPDIVIEIKK
ncbi:MAG TPA: sulfurtransferase TusA family protein [Syntrophales bacterium]|nr:sulfurtransferase TusA family protein [Syntrophobacterales bacterium]HNQ01339.1 sulfurtransferase TusA family protein [Syntrophales bacterium]HQL90434.1 sulfurtransferase TusA family protein [Syntrophales bacterium]